MNKYIYLLLLILPINVYASDDVFSCQTQHQQECWVGLSFDSSSVGSECKAILPNTNLHRRKYEIDMKNKKITTWTWRPKIGAVGHEAGYDKGSLPITSMPNLKYLKKYGDTIFTSKGLIWTNGKTFTATETFVESDYSISRHYFGVCD